MTINCGHICIRVLQLFVQIGIVGSNISFISETQLVVVLGYNSQFLRKTIQSSEQFFGCEDQVPTITQALKILHILSCLRNFPFSQGFPKINFQLDITLIMKIRIILETD